MLLAVSPAKWRPVPRRESWNPPGDFKSMRSWGGESSELERSAEKKWTQALPNKLDSLSWSVVPAHLDAFFQLVTVDRQATSSPIVFGGTLPQVLCFCYDQTSTSVASSKPDCSVRYLSTCCHCCLSWSNTFYLLYLTSLKNMHQAEHSTYSRM